MLRRAQYDRGAVRPELAEGPIARSELFQKLCSAIPRKHTNRGRHYRILESTGLGIHF